MQSRVWVLIVFGIVFVLPLSRLSLCLSVSIECMKPLPPAATVPHCPARLDTEWSAAAECSSITSFYFCYVFSTLLDGFGQYIPSISPECLSPERLPMLYQPSTILYSLVASVPPLSLNFVLHTAFILYFQFNPLLLLSHLVLLL